MPKKPAAPKPIKKGMPPKGMPMKGMKGKC
jgi:hypothetical protein